MFKHLQKLLLVVALCVPWVTQAQVTCDSGAPDTVTNLPAGSTASSTSSYFPGYSFYNYSYSEVIIPSSQLEDGGVTEIKALMFKPSSTTAGTYFNNCTIYLANTTVQNLSSGFVNASDYEMVWSGSMNYTTTNWQSIEFDDSFMWDGSSNIVVAVKRDHGSYTSGSTFVAFSAGASLGRYVYQDSGPYTLGSVSGGTATSTVGWYKLVGCAGDPVTCNRVRNLTASDILYDGFTLTWLDTLNTNATYTVYNMSDTSVIASNLSTNTYTLTGLDANTVYVIGVVADCGAGDVSAYAKITVRTACAGLDELPYFYGFEDAATGTSATFPSCWTRINDATGTYNYYPYVYGSAGHGSSKGLYWYMSISTDYANNEYAILPPVDPTAYDVADLTLSFWAGATSATYHPVFVVGVMSDPTDTSSFVPVDTINNIINVWTPYAVNFENYTGTGTYVAIKAFRPTSAWYAYMDDITLLESSDFCAPVSNVSAVTTTTSITLSWDGDASGEYIVYHLGVDSVMVTGTTVTFDNLANNTSHEFLIAHLCTDTSDFVYFGTRTDCDDVVDLPVTYNFDDQATGTAADFAYCWTRYNSAATYQYYPYITSNSSYSHSGSNCLYIYSYTSSAYPDTMLAILPQVDSTLYEISDLEVVFYASTSSSSYYPVFELGVYVENADTAYFQPVDTISVLYSNGVAEYSTSFAGYDGPNGRVAFRFLKSMMTATYSYCYLYLDDVTIREANDCAIPDNFVVNAANPDSVMVTWQEMGEATSWQLVYGPAGFNPDTVDENNIIVATDTVYYIEELPGGITYQAYVRADCGDGTSYWAGPVAFTPGSINMGITGNATMYVCNAVIYDNGGATGQYADNCHYTLTLYPNDDTKRFKFWGSGNTESCCDYFRVYAGAAATGTMLASVQGTATIDTVTTQGGPITLLFHSDGSVHSYDGFELHLMCEDLPPCRDVEDVTVEEVSTSSAYVTWTNAIGTTPLPSSYVVSVYDSTNNVVATVTTSDMFAMVGGLDPTTDYTVTVVPECSESNGMAAGTTFTTAGFGCLQVDATLAFSDTIGNGTSTNSYLPSYSFYNYGLTQQIYTAAEIGHGGQIDNISFMWSTVAQQRTYEIYMGHVNSATASDFVHPVDLTCVYNGGAITLTANQWTTFNLTTPFNYNGTDNLVVIMRDLTGSYVSGNYGYVHSAASDAARYAYQDSGPYDPATFSGGYSLSVRNNIILGGAPCAVEATCAVPLVVVTGKTSTTVDLMWAAGSAETAWQVEHKAASDATWTVDFASTTLTNATISNLAPNTDYQFRVYHLCGTDTFATVRTVRTDCVGAAVPFSENFSSWGTGSASPAPDCWFKLSNYSTGYPYISTSPAMGDGKSVYFYASGTTHSALVLPKMDAPIDTLLLSGFVRYSSNGYNLDLGVITDVTDYSTFHAVSSVSTVANQWVPFEVSFVGQPEGNIALSVGEGGSYVYLYVDNIEVNYFNPCIRPTNLNATGITQTSANLSWTDTATTNFIVEYGPAGFAHGTGTQMAVTGNSTQLTGLAHSTVYDVYVRGICGDGDSSNWSFVYQLATSCGTISSLPITETFNNWGTGSTVHAPNCWGYGSTYSSTYPYIYDYYNHSGTTGGAMYMYNYSTNDTYFSLPEVDSNAYSVSDLQVYFFAFNPSSTTTYVADVIVGVCTSPGNMSTFVAVDTITLNYEGANAWRPYEVAFDSYTGNGRYITFLAKPSAGSTYCYPVIDDVTLELIPTCQRPTDLTASNATSNSVDLAWNDRANASQWQIEYGPTGFTLGTGTIVIANSNPFTLTGLPASYQGEYYVKAICSSTDSGDYSRNSCGFATSQVPATIPYNYNFEDGAEWANWQVNSNVATNWYRGTAVSSGNSGYSMYVSVDSGATYKPYQFNGVVNTVSYRDIDFGTIDSSYTITFSARAGGNLGASYDGLVVLLVDPSAPVVASTGNITSPWGDIRDLYHIASVRIDTNWHTYRASFDTISGIHRVAFYWFNQNTGSETSYGPSLLEPAAVDNIVIDYSPCPRPVATTVTAMGSTSANLSWVGPAVANYEVIYRKTSQGPADNIFLQSNTNSITLTGLEALTEYAVWVRKFCGNDTSLTSDVMRFTTDMCDGAEYIMIGDSNMSTTTSYNVPLNNFYNYTLCEIIIDSAELGDNTEFSAISFYYTYTSASTDKTDVDIYIMPTTDSVFSSTSDMRAIDSSAVLVYSGNLNCTQGWNMFGFDTVYTWDGHSNLIVIIDDNSGDYNGSAYTFRVRNCNGNKTIDWYSDSYNPDVTNTSSYSGSMYLRTFRPEMQLISCGAGCRVPTLLPATDVTYNSATISWNSIATDFEVAVKAATDAEYPAPTAVSNASSYVVNGLAPATMYRYHVRAICDADAGLISDWVEGTFVTDSLPCFDPTALAVQSTSYTTATLGWTANGEESAWRIHVWNTTFDQTYDVTSNPATVTGLVSDVEYSAEVLAVCGGVVESGVSNTVTFRTARCEAPTNVTSSNITAHTAVISWSGDASSYRVEYGTEGFGTGEGTSVTSTATSVTLTGLTDDQTYDVYVYAVCAEGLESAASQKHTFETTTEGIDIAGGMNVSIYPNPTTSATTVALSGVNGEVTITVVDMNGRVVKSETLSCDGDCTKRMDVEGLAQGAYFVRVSGENLNMVKKLVVK